MDDRTPSEYDGDVVCGSQRTIDGWTNEPMGWLYGIHLIYKMPSSCRCPRCGLSLEKDPTNG
jgi:hypothetical protein